MREFCDAISLALPLRRRLLLDAGGSNDVSDTIADMARLLREFKWQVVLMIRQLSLITKQSLRSGEAEVKIAFHVR